MDVSALRPGLTYEFKFKIPDDKTVPLFYPESPEFQVFEQTVGTDVKLPMLNYRC